MKLHSFIAEILFFSLIFLAFVLPPCFRMETQMNPELFTDWNFPFLQLILALAAGCIFFIFRNSFYKKEKTGINIVFFPVIYTVCLLFCFSLFIKFFSTLPYFSSAAASISVKTPDSLPAWIFCILNFLFAAFYEEIIYRFYLPDALYALISRRCTKTFVLIICEVFAALTFAAAHLYLGIFSVINAALAHIVLRLCYKKSGKIWPAVCSHFIYNVISLILL
ncbi:MAG: CPBP family intramembrane metalloprotease [Treponema sp.]|nr:CPBP family intramembrane metalloprotease [Treponema sp.]